MLVLELHLEQRVGQRLDDRCHYLNRIFLRQTLSSKGPDFIPTPRRITCFADFGGPALFRVQEGRRRTQTPFVSLLESSPIREELANPLGRTAWTKLHETSSPWAFADRYSRAKTCSGQCSRARAFPTRRLFCLAYIVSP